MSLASLRRRLGSAVPAGRTRFLPIAVLVPVSLAMLFSPGSTVPSGPENSDKVVHGLLFAALAVAVAIAGTRRAVSVPLLLAYAALSEVLQGTLPIHRTGDVWDFVADAVGVAIGTVVGLAAGIPTSSQRDRKAKRRRRGPRR